MAAWATGSHCLVLALLSPALMIAGRLAQRLRLPLITGYVLGGILVGPYALDLLRAENLLGLVPVEAACLAVIAFSAGAELQLGDLRKIRKQVACITLGVSLWTWAAVFGALCLLAPATALLRALPPRQAQAIASLAATLMVARSPASMVAVLKETEGKGPYCSLISAIVVVKDVLVFVCFAVNIELAQVSLRSSAGALSAAHLLEPGLSLAKSCGVGLGAGLALGRTLPAPARAPGWPLRLAPAALQPRIRAGLSTAAIAGWAVGSFAVASGLGAEPLLACVLTGVVSTNRRGEAASRSGQEEVHAALHWLMPGVNMAFFALTGASLALGSVVRTLWAAGVLWVVRLGAVYVGSWSGAWLGGTPVDMRRRVWQGMVTQAGVAMGLAKAVGSQFPSWGPEFVAVMVTVIMLNLLVGPLLFRAAVVGMGEARAAATLPLHGAGGGGQSPLGDKPAPLGDPRTPPSRPTSATPRLLREASEDHGAATAGLKERQGGEGPLHRGHDRGPSPSGGPP